MCCAPTRREGTCCSQASVGKLLWMSGWIPGSVDEKPGTEEWQSLDEWLLRLRCSLQTAGHKGGGSIEAAVGLGDV